MVSRFPRVRRVFLGSALLVAGLVAGPFTAHNAGATFSTCDTDPIVVLSNGQVVSMAVHILDDPSDVTNITYELHGPVGTRVLATFYTSGMASKESVKYYADEPQANTFDSTTTASTGLTGAPLTATTTVFGLSTGLATSSLSGLSGQSLPVHLGS